MKSVEAAVPSYSADGVLYPARILLLLCPNEHPGIKAFVAPTWANDWTRLHMHEFDLYKAILSSGRMPPNETSPSGIHINGIFTKHVPVSLKTQHCATGEIR